MRRTTTGLTPTLVLLILAASAQAGLVHRQNRHANSIAVTIPELGTESLIPVQVITDGLQLDNEKVQLQSEAQQALKTEELKTSLGTEAVPVPSSAPEVIAEKVAEPTNTADSLQTVDALVESERQQDEQIIKQEITQAIVEENKELLQAAAIADKASELQSGGQPQQLQQFLKQAQEINTELKNGVPAAADADAAAAAATYFSAPDVPVAEPNSAEVAIGSDTLKSASLIADTLPAESQNAIAVQQLVSNEAAEVSVSANDESATANQVRQAAATQATPTQTTTQQNFVQQLIQNSPLGQFFGQLTGQQQLAAQGAQVAADQPATPAPTLPGFLNPQNAITQVQNAAQSVANATAQAFQGVQQFATSLGNQFQNTLSSLGGQQQTLSTADSTTLRPPGPIQSLISNFVGGNPQAGVAAAASDTPNPTPTQPQGPLQGIITFLQGGNRPQAVAGASGGAAVVATAPAGSIIPAAAGASSDSVNKEELTDPAVAEEQAQIDQTDNEVRNSAEVGDDSLEDSNPDQLIIVNDDASELNHREDEKATAVVA